MTVVNARAETWPEGVGVHDLVTARALGALPVILEYAAPLLAEGGHVVAWKGAVSDEEAAGGAAAAAILGLEPLPVARGHAVPGRARPHAARVPQDRAHARARFPRRAGMAGSKRPAAPPAPGGEVPLNASCFT